MAQEVDETSSSSSPDHSESMRMGHQLSNPSKPSLDDELYKEQLLLEKELSDLKMNGYISTDSGREHEGFTPSHAQPMKQSSGGSSNAYPAKHSVMDTCRRARAPELLSDDSMDREVEGLLNELCGSRELGYGNPYGSSGHTAGNNHSMTSLQGNKRSLNGAPIQTFNSCTRGYGTSVFHEPPAVHMKQELSRTYPTAEHSLRTRLPMGRSARHQYPVNIVTNEQEAAKEFLIVRKQEQFLKERIRQQRQFLEQKLDEATRQDVEEQYFDAQEELCRVEKTLIYLCGFLTQAQVKWLLKNGPQAEGTTRRLDQPVDPISSNHFSHGLQNGDQYLGRAVPSDVNLHTARVESSRYSGETERKPAPRINVTNVERQEMDDTLLCNSLYKHLLSASMAMNGSRQAQDAASVASSARSVQSDKQTQTIMDRHTQTDPATRNGTIGNCVTSYVTERSPKFDAQYVARNGTKSTAYGQTRDVQPAEAIGLDRKLPRSSQSTAKEVESTRVALGKAGKPPSFDDSEVPVIATSFSFHLSL